MERCGILTCRNIYSDINVSECDAELKGSPPSPKRGSDPRWRKKRVVFGRANLPPPHPKLEGTEAKGDSGLKRKVLLWVYSEKFVS